MKASLGSFTAHNAMDDPGTHRDMVAGLPRDWSRVINRQAVLRRSQFLEKQGVKA